MTVATAAEQALLALLDALGHTDRDVVRLCAQRHTDRWDVYVTEEQIHEHTLPIPPVEF